MIFLRWVNPNLSSVAIDEVRIYRSDASMDPENLPSPLVILPGQSTSYEDSSAVNGNAYYYIIEFLSGSETALSNQQQITAPNGAEPPIEPPPVTATHLYAYDSTGRLLYSKDGDKVIDEWASTRKILSALVVWEEKKDVWDTEYVEITSSDITSTGTEFRSGAVDGDELTWKGVIELMLVPSMSDVAGLITRVIGQHLLDRYGIGETPERAISYWMSTAAIRAGARNCIVFSNTSTFTAPQDEIINTNILMSCHSLARCLEFVLRVPELRAIMQLDSVSVPVLAGGTLDHPTIDRLQSAWDANGNPTGYKLDNYIAGKTGDSTWGNQVFAIEMPSGDTMYATIYHSTTRELRYRDAIRLIMAAENHHPHLRANESASDPHASQVELRIEGNFPPSDSSNMGRTISNQGVTASSSVYMTEDSLDFNGSSYLIVQGTKPDLSDGDFTIEGYLRGRSQGVGDSIQTLAGIWRTNTGGRSWLLRVNSSNLEFLYSTDGNNNVSITCAVPSTYSLNGSPTHVCVQRSGGDLAVFFNGQRGAITSVSGVTIQAPSASTQFIVGARETGAGSTYEQFLSCHLDEFILTKGLARYGMAGFRPRYRPSRWD